MGKEKGSLSFVQYYIGLICFFLNLVFVCLLSLGFVRTSFCKKNYCELRVCLQRIASLVFESAGRLRGLVDSATTTGQSVSTCRAWQVRSPSPPLFLTFSPISVWEGLTTQRRVKDPCIDTIRFDRMIVTGLSNVPDLLCGCYSHHHSLFHVTGSMGSETSW